MTQDIDLLSQVQQKANLAVAQFQQRAGGRLDYSEHSIAMVEEMLAEASQYINHMSEPDIKALVELMGAYMLEVVRRNHGGTYQWHAGRAQPVLVVGQPQSSIAIQTFDKVRGRLFGDEADNLEFFFRGFVERVQSASPGANAIYV